LRRAPQVVAPEAADAAPARQSFSAVTHVEVPQTPETCHYRPENADLQQLLRHPQRCRPRQHFFPTATLRRRLNLRQGGRCLLVRPSPRNISIASQVEGVRRAGTPAVL